MILREIHQALGYGGSYTTLKAYVRAQRTMRPSRATVRFETPPGRQLQSDWGQIGVRIGGVETEVHFIVNTLGYSRRCFPVALPHARVFLEFCRAHKIRTFLLSTVARDHFDAQQRACGFGEFLDKPYLGVWDKRQKIHEILHDNKLRAEETLFIGDMQHDIETARHGGIHSCAVLTGYNTLEQLRAARAQAGSTPYALRLTPYALRILRFLLTGLTGD